MSVVSPVAGVPDFEHPLHRDFPNAAELEGEPDHLDVQRHAPMVAHPDEDGRQRADERSRSIAKNLVAVPRCSTSSRSRVRLRRRSLRFGSASGTRGAEFQVLGAAGLCLIKAKATSLAADLVIATGALSCF